MKVYGQLEKAQIENLATDPTGAGLVPGLVWFNTATSVYKGYNGTAVVELADLTTAQAFTNKTFVAPEFTGSFTAGQEASTPTNPVAGKHKIYFKTDGLLYQLDENGVELPVGSGSGTGSKNYLGILDSDFDASLGAWTTDDGVGGAALGTTIALTSTPAEVLAGTQSMKISKDGANRNGELVKVALQPIDLIDRGKTLFGQFAFTPITGYSSGDLIVEVYDVTNSKVLYSGTDEAVEIMNNKGVVSFATSVEDTTENVELRLKVNTASLVAFDVSVDEFIFGPRAVILSPKQQEVALTSGATNAPTSTSSIASMAATLDTQGSVSAAGFTCQSDGEYKVEGFMRFASASGGFRAVQIYKNGNFLERIYSNNGTPSSNTTAPFSYTDTFVKGDVIRMGCFQATGATEAYEFEALINRVVDGETSAVTDYQLSLQTVVAKTTRNATHTMSTSSTKIPFNSVAFDSHGAFNSAGDIFTAPRSGYYEVNAQVIILGENTPANVDFTIAKNGVTAGQTDKTITSNETIALRWLDYVEKGDTLEIRATDPEARDIFAAAVRNFFQIKSVPDFTVLGAIQKDEYLEVTDFSNVTGTSSLNNWETPVPGWTLPLTPGVWEIGCIAQNIIRSNISGSSIYLGAAICTSPTPGVGRIIGETSGTNGSGEIKMVTSRLFLKRVCSDCTSKSLLSKDSSKLRVCNGCHSKQFKERFWFGHRCST